jgi:hypothetical protein
MNTEKPKFYSQLTFSGFYWDTDEHGYTRIRIHE